MILIDYSPSLQQILMNLLIMSLIVCITIIIIINIYVYSLMLNIKVKKMISFDSLDLIKNYFYFSFLFPFSLILLKIKLYIIPVTFILLSCVSFFFIIKYYSIIKKDIKTSLVPKLKKIIKNRSIVFWFSLFALVLLVYIPGLILPIPNADDLKGHTIHSLLMYNQLVLFPDISDIAKDSFLISGVIFYPPFAYCYFLFYYSFFHVLNINIAYVMNSFIRFSVIIIYLIFYCLACKYFPKIKNEILLSLIVLNTQYYNLSKWGGFPFTISISLFLIYIDSLFKLGKENLCVSLEIFLINALIFLTHFNTYGLVILINIVFLSQYAFDKKSNINFKHIISVLMVFLFFIIIESCIVIFQIPLSNWLSSKSLDDITRFLLNKSSWHVILWDYIRTGQTGLVGLFTFNILIIDRLFYYIQQFYISFLFSIIVSIEYIFKRKKYITKYLSFFIWSFIFANLLLLIFQSQIFFGVFIRFPLALYLYRIERVYFLICIVLSPILSGWLIKKWNLIGKINCFTKSSKSNITKRKLQINIKIILKITMCIIVLSSLFIETYVVSTRTVLYYDDEIINSYKWISENLNENDVILNDDYGQWIPIFTYSKKIKITNPFYSSNDQIFTFRKNLYIFEVILSFNYTKAIDLLNKNDITYVFVSNQQPNSIYNHLKEKNITYSFDEFNKCSFLIPVYVGSSVRIYKVMT